MMRPSRESRALAGRFTLAIASAPRPGRTGEQLTRTAGAGAELHDARAYQLGDDVRRIDWRAFARSDQLSVRVWRDEVLAKADVLLDASRSMAVDPSKAQLSLDLTSALAHCAEADGVSTRIVTLGPEPRALRLEEFDERGVEFEDATPLDAALRRAAGLVRPGSIVVVVSDWLCPQAPRALLGPLVARAGALACVQVLGPSELDPQVGDAVRLVDAESGETLDLVLEPHVVAEYVERAEALREALRDECRRSGARFASLDASRTLEELARRELLSCDVLAPR